jgi:hypothetical protein
MSRKFFSDESGQATMELVFILLAMAALAIAMIALFSVESADNTLLLRAKYDAEYAVAYDDSEVYVQGSEIRTWQRASVDYDRRGDSVSIPFTASDVRIASKDNSIAETANELSLSRRSASEDYDYYSIYPSDAGFSCGRIDEIALQNSFSAAYLVRRRGDDGSASGASSDKLYSRGTFHREFGNLIGKMPDPHENQTNYVYMPAIR